jgi:hypothetical protein
MYVSVLSITFARNISYSDEYLTIYARGIETHVDVHVKLPLS